MVAMKKILFAVVAVALVAWIVVAIKKHPQAAKNTSEVVNAPTTYIKTVTDEKKNLEKKVDVTSLNHAIQQFQVQEGRYPKDLNELVTQHYLGKVPDAPYGYKINYDSKSGTVTVTQQ